MIKTLEKDKYFSQKKIDIAGSAADNKTHIYQLCDSKIMVRETHIKSNKGGEPIEILQFTDTHLNKLNQRDIDENNPVIASTRQYRMAFRNESTVPNVKNAMELVPFFDQTVITGDVMDYLTWGSLELMDELIWKDNPDILVAVGMHDLVRKMEGAVQDPTTLSSRIDIVKDYWRHDMFYTSRVLGDKVMVIVMYNNTQYFDFQAEKLRADLDRARQENLIVVIFQHEQLCTRKSEDEYVEPIRENTRMGSRNFYKDFLGNESADEATLDVIEIIKGNGDIIKGIFCGHRHNDFYTEIPAYYMENGKRTDTVIPQYVLTGNMYDEGHVMIIKID